MSGRHRLSRVAADLNKIKQDETIEIPGELGLKLGGERLVEVPSRLGYVYVRLRNDQSEVVQVFNDKVSPVYGLPVIVVRDKVDRGRYYIKGRDTGRYNVWGSSAYLPFHGAMHSFNPEAPGADIVWVYSQQYTPLLAVPSGSNAGMNVVIYPGSIYYGNRWVYFGVTGTASFDQYRPTGTNQARMVLITINTAGNPVLTPGNYFTADTTGSQQIYDQIPTVPSTSVIPIAAVRLVSGTSFISWENLYDLRQFFSMITGSSAGASFTGTAGHIIADAGNPLTQRGTLSFNNSQAGQARAFTVWDDSGNDRTIISGSWSGHRIYQDNTVLTGRKNLVFAGPAFSLFDSGSTATDKTIVSGSFPGHRIQYNGVGLTQRGNLNFVGSGLVAYDDSSNDRIIISGVASAGVDTDEKVKVSSNDTTAGYLNGKLVEGVGISLTELNNGSNETFRVSFTGSVGGGGTTIGSYQTAFADENGNLTGSNSWRTFIKNQGGGSYPVTVLGAWNMPLPPTNDNYYSSYALNVVQSDAGGRGSIGVYSFGGYPLVDLLQSRGSETGNSTTLKGDFLGAIAFNGVSEAFNPPYWDTVARIRSVAEVDFNVSQGDGGSLRFDVGPTGTFSLREMMAIRGTRIDFTGTAHFHGDYIEADGDLRIGSGSSIYLGSPTQDGSWRLRRDANNLVYERRESSSWVLKQTISA